MKEDNHSETEEIGYTIFDISVCTHCEFYKWVGTHGASQYCQNKESPFYNPGHPELRERGLTPEWRGTDLTTQQMVSGCEMLAFDGQKIHPLIYRKIPKDSQLRLLPREEVILGYKPEMDPYLENDSTSEDHATATEEFQQKLIEVMEKERGKGGMSLGELEEKVGAKIKIR